MTNIKNKQEPNLHGIMLRLGGFHTLQDFLRQCQVQVFGHYLHLIHEIPLQIETTESQESAS